MYSKELNSGEPIESQIFLVRGKKVMLSTQLAELYAVKPKVLMQAVKRNVRRFPDDFMFRLTREEAASLRPQRALLTERSRQGSRSQIVTLNRGENVKHLPYAFTEQGVAMLSGILRSYRAISVNIEIMRAFVRLRHTLAAHADLALKLSSLEKKYDSRFKVVFDALRDLMNPPKSKNERRIGFNAQDR
jgi:hypothetical protein